MVKKPSLQATNRPDVTTEQAEALANKLADKPYGHRKELSKKSNAGPQYH